jgi:hypothetical protein
MLGDFRSFGYASRQKTGREGRFDELGESARAGSGEGREVG